MSDLLPKLKEITVHPNQLRLDPNNPRFLTCENDKTPEKNFNNNDVILRTRNEMNYGDHDVKPLKDAIRTHGWQPVDMIYVREYSKQDGKSLYYVIEGNRRLTAIENLLVDDVHPIDAELRESLEQLTVMEITDKVNPRKKLESEAELQKKIDYLLGVRHHGSLHGWSPFAQATYMYEKYLDRGGYAWDTFSWNETNGQELATRLSIDNKIVKNRLMVYRAMRQIGETDRVKNSEADGGGMKDHYFSIVKHGIEAKLSSYIKFDPTTFLLDDQSVTRMIDLCYFDKKARGLYPKSKEKSPFNNPQQWKDFENIIKEGNPEDLRRVEEGKEQPEYVWADRLKEMQTPEWGMWLEDVKQIFQRLTIADIKINDSSKAQFARLTQLLTQLNGSK